ncbi:MAG: hypothetical protein DRP42_05045 [Tenericutes bacterium]|nr:MAG: hypothetical protein DRP42_05045 [Mycoplasmatota bacterium]
MTALKSKKVITKHHVKHLVADKKAATEVLITLSELAVNYITPEISSCSPRTAKKTNYYDF